MQKEASPAGERPPVLVITCGRSGSTLLLRMLNCLPETIMWGEHNGALKPLLNAYGRFRDVADNRFVAQAADLLQPVYDRQPILSERGMSIEWLNWFTAADIDRLYRNLISDLFYPESLRGRFSRWGFKEIQYRDAEFDKLRQLFPGMKAIVLYRNPAHVLASQFKNFAKNDAERMPKVLTNIENFFQFAAHRASQQDQAEDPPLFISYEEIVGDFKRSLLKLQDFVNEEFSPSIEEIGNDIIRFRKRRTSAALSSDPLEDFDRWQKAAGVKGPPKKKVQLIAGYYETVVKASTVQQETTGTELSTEPR